MADSMSLEIVKFEDDQVQFETVNELIEYVPEEAEFEEYEYIEVEESEATNQLSSQWNENQVKIEDARYYLTGYETGRPITTEDKSLIIKLETDNRSIDARDMKLKCSNRKCKRENSHIFFSQVELDEHNLVHLKQITENECPICNKILANPTKLNVHMESRHIPKIFTCDNCAKTFRSKDNLRLHMSHHRKHFIVECRACKKTYKSMQSLRYHLRQHFEHHQCETCGKVFEHKKLLIGHIAAKHNQELMLQCQYCTRMFSRADVRDAHEREIHRNGFRAGSHFKCNECECAFDLRDELTSHKILNHYAGVLHTCCDCGKNFKKKSLLDMHAMSHKEKTLQCDVCKMMFTFVTGLSKHKKLGRCKGPPASAPASKLNKEEIAKIAKAQLLEITVNPSKKPELDLFSDLKEEKDVEPVKVNRGRKPLPIVKSKYALDLSADVAVENEFYSIVKR